MPQKPFQTIEGSAHLTEAGGIPGDDNQSPGPYDSGEDGEDDPMVSEPIHSFLLPIRLTAPKTGTQGTFQALIDTGCTRCLINLPTVKKLGIRAKRLNHPIRFEQVDGSLVGGAYATHLTEPVKLELADHWEMIRFIIAPKMTDPVILGLSWLDKWEPTIWWQGGTRRLRIAKGPQPLPSQQGETPPAPESQPLPVQQGEAPQAQGPHRMRITEQLAAASDNSTEAEQIPEEYQDLAEVFSEAECDVLPPHRETDCAIEIIPGAKLPKPKLYAMTPREMQEMRNYIDKNLKRGFIEPAKPRVAAPVLFREKKDGSMRLVVDFRGINAVCVHNLYPLPLMKDMLAHLAKGKVFTKLDLREAYYRVRIKEGDEWKTAFNCPLGSFQFKVMPFGLQGAPAVFMQLINEVLHEHLYKGVLVYLDDILIYTETLDNHIPLVRQVLEKLLAANLYVKLSKCDFHQARLDYLGYRVSNEGIEMDPAKVQAVLSWQPPRTRRQLQSFLGFANFYRQFIPSFARIAKPLTDLLKTGSPATKPRPGQPLQWDLTCQQAFDELKEMFAKEPVLKHPDPEQPFVIQTDASDVAVGAVLLQRNSQENLQPCAYTSHKFTDTERRWAAWEKEAFAVRWALLTWRHLLEGGQKPFEVWTDHKNLEALRTPRKLSPKQVRWAQYFNRFNFELKHIPGGKNFLADALSRMPQYKSEREQVVDAIIPSTQAAGQVITRRQHRDQRDQPATDLTAKLKTELLADPWFRDNQHLLTKRDDLAWKGPKLYVPETLRTLILKRSHDVKPAGHFGFLKTLHLVRRQFWWPHMRKDVDSYVKSCTICATMKKRPGKPPGLLQPVADPTRPWEEIAMDFIVELPKSGGSTVIWTVIDLFSKQAHFIPCSGLPSARQLAKLFLKHIYRLHGVPRRIISDRGVQFTAKFWREFLRSIGSSQGLSSAFHPSTNGGAERLNAMIEKYLRCYVNYQQSNWADLLSFAEVAYNNAVHSSTGLTPFKIVSGMDFVPMPEYPREPPSSVSLTEWMETLRKTWENVKKALAKAAQSYKEQADKHRTPQRPFQVGEKVYLSTKYLRLRLPSRKLGPKFIGPFPIVKVINPVTVQLKLPRLLGKIHPVFHSSLLKPVVGSTLRPVPRDPPGPLVIGGQTHYEVQRILDSRWHRGHLQYLIKWKGYPLSEASWVKSRNVQADRLVAKFHADHPNKPGGAIPQTG